MQKWIAVCGATASGKTRLAIDIAKANNGEIICADSMQIYSGIEVITASPTREEKGQVPHHLFNFVDLMRDMSIAEYARMAHAKIDEVASRGKLPILVGGTGLYMDSIVRNRKFINVDIDDKLRFDLNSRNVDELYNALLKIDSITAEKCKYNKRRLARALEIYYLTGNKKSDLDACSEREAKYDVDYIGKYYNRSDLIRRINERVDIMLRTGAIDECKQDFGVTSGKAIGVSAIKFYLESKITLQEARERICIETRQYAKRQETWFKRNKQIIWLKGN